MKALITGVSGQQHAAGGGATKGGGVVSAERLESIRRFLWYPRVVKSV